MKQEWFENIQNPSTLHIISNIYIPRNILSDRFNILNDNCEYYLYSRNEDINYIKSLPNMTFEECCNKRTNEFIDLSNKLNKDIYVSWSGGVDSTCIISSFLMNDRLDKSRFHVVHSLDAIEEYPFFYEFLIKNKIDIFNAEHNIYNFKNFVKDNILVNGNCGDQLDGSNLHTRIYKDIDYFSNWKDSVDKIVHKYHRRPYSIEKCLSDIEKYANMFSLNLKYFGEFAWMCNFGIKWSYVSEVLMPLYDNPELCIAFFDTPYFSKYGLSNTLRHSLNKQSNNYLYKNDWKKIIYSLTKDEDYFLHKGKDAHFINGPTADYGVVIKDTSMKNYQIYTDISDKELHTKMLEYIKPEYKEAYRIESKYK